MESIQGLVEHIVYHNDTNGYTVFSLMCQGEEIVCVGNVTSLDEGEYLKARVNIRNIRYMETVQGDFHECGSAGRMNIPLKDISVPGPSGVWDRHWQPALSRNSKRILSGSLKKNRSAWLRSRASVNAKPGRSISSFMRSRICVRP